MCFSALQILLFLFLLYSLFFSSVCQLHLAIAIFVKIFSDYSSLLLSEYIRGRIIFILYLSRLNFKLISSQQLLQLFWKPVAFVLISKKGVCFCINKYRVSYYHQFKLHCWETVNTASLNLEAQSLIWQPIWFKYSLPSFSTVKLVSYNSILKVLWRLYHAPYYYYYYYYYYYEWQLSCHSVAVVLTDKTNKNKYT